jgi:hypothetical protein
MAISRHTSWSVPATRIELTVLQASTASPRQVNAHLGNGNFTLIGNNMAVYSLGSNTSGCAWSYLLLFLFYIWGNGDTDGKGVSVLSAVHLHLLYSFMGSV